MFSTPVKVWPAYTVATPAPVLPVTLNASANPSTAGNRQQGGVDVVSSGQRKARRDIRQCERVGGGRKAAQGQVSIPVPSLEMS
jgi:hypothetical protein